MGLGVRVIPDDSGRPIDITANCRVPQFCGQMRCVPGQTYNVPGYIAGSQVFVIVESFGTMNINLGMRGKPPNGWTYQPLAIQSVTISGGTFRLNYAPNSLAMNIVSDPTYGTFGGVIVWVFQILPVGDNKWGIRLENATNLMSITNQGNTLRPIWRGKININGKWDFPTLAGYDKYKMIPFAHWTNGNIGLTRFVGLLNVQSSPSLVSMAGNQTGKYNGLGTAAQSGEIEVVIFYPMAPEPTHLGINVWNASSQCVWSTKYTPFLLRGNINLSKGWSTAIPGVQRAMIPITIGGFNYTGPNGLYQQYGIRSNGNQFTVTPVTCGYTTKGSPAFSVVNNVAIPVIDAADYF